MKIYGVAQVQKDFQNGGYYKTLSFHDIKSGSNGPYSTSTGWDAVTGMGSFVKYTPSSNSPTTTTSPSSNSPTTTSPSYNCPILFILSLLQYYYL